MRSRASAASQFTLRQIKNQEKSFWSDQYLVAFFTHENTTRGGTNMELESGIFVKEQKTVRLKARVE